MNTSRRRARFKNFRNVLDSGSSSTVVTGTLRSKLKLKNIRNYVGNPRWEVHDLKEGECIFLPAGV